MSAGAVRRGLAGLIAVPRERHAALHIPYAAHIAREVIKTHAGDYVQAFAVGGASFEAADDAVINQWHERLNVLWRNLASPNVALWTQVVRRRETGYPVGEAAPGFAADLESRYRQRLQGQTLMVNELYVSLVYRAQPSAAGSLAVRLWKVADAEHEVEEQREAVSACAKLRDSVLAALAEYDVRVLGIEERNGRAASSLLEFLGLLINGEAQRLSLPRMPLNNVLCTSRVFFGREAIEYRTPTATRLGAFLGIKEYPTPTTPGMFNRLLNAPFSFVLTQSFTFLPKPIAQGLLARQLNRLVNAGDLAVSQSEALTEAMDKLASNEFVLGDHHFSLQVLDELVPGEVVDAEPRLKRLDEYIALARTLLADTGMVVAREDIALEAAFWAQLPGNFSMRTRKSPITSRNFAAMAPLHNYPTGSASGNHWGPAVTVLATSAHSPLFFSLHARDEREAGARSDIGHTFICGPTGSGKTVLLGFLVAALTKFGATQVVFDKDRGLEILVRALGGEYLVLKNGLPTGFNPLQLPQSAANVEFLHAWLHRLVSRGGETLSVQQEADLAQALRGTLALAPASRRLSSVLEFLDPTDPEGTHARLTRWCERTQAGVPGELAWVFDNRSDSAVNLLSGHALIGIDVTEFLDNEVTRAPVSLYLFHLIRQLLDGRRLAVWMDEFAKILGDPGFGAFAKDGLKTWRKMNALGVFATQSASDVLQAPIARTIIEQTPTKIFFPNAQASQAEYCEGFGLSRREYELIARELTLASRSFLIKQGHHSVVASLNLSGFDFELAVISGRTATVERLQGLMAQFGADPARWLPEFQRQVQSGA